MVGEPLWFRDDAVIISNAPTCGINKDGDVQYVVDSTTGERSSEEIDDCLWDDVRSIVEDGEPGEYVSVEPRSSLEESHVYVPNYYDYSSLERLNQFIAEHLEGFSARSLAGLIEEGMIDVRSGHGSPSLDQRIAREVPYVKVSDLRAGHVNINPTNMIPRALAEKEFWGGSRSGLRAFDILTPERASKNIGEFCMLLPGQEPIVLTREIIVIRATPDAPFDQFYLMWALSLEVVLAQWDRIILMQTNREDVGDRFYEIEIPVPKEASKAEEVSGNFRSYYEELAELRAELYGSLEEGPGAHHFYAVWHGDQEKELGPEGG